MRELITRMLVWLAALRSLLRLRRQRRSDDPATAHPTPEELARPIERELPPERRSEVVVAALLLVAALFGFGFTALYAFDGHNTQLLGIAIGGALMLLAAAMIVAGKYVVIQEKAVEDRDELLDEATTKQVVELVESGADGVSRRTLLTAAGGVAGCAMLTAAATPLASLGPRLTRIHATPWHRGVGLVDEFGKPYHAADIEIGSFYTALPQVGDTESLGAGLVLLKLPQEMIHLPTERAHWAPQGIMAYSKICTHAACAVSLYRYPTFEPDTGTEPALTCPCHYSTFLPGEGGKVSFGPAGRPLPQLPLTIEADGRVTAAGGFDEDIGPAWWDVHRA